MNWYLIYTKPRQERCALDNLQWQGYECYFPTMPAEKLRFGKLGVVDQALFPRYLFIRLGQGPAAQSWAPIRSTKGVSRLVSFGTIPAKVDDALIALFGIKRHWFRLNLIAFISLVSEYVSRQPPLLISKAFSR